jgi:creatinine amidohydrolase
VAGIQHADLTWPEVAELPRDLPMLIPLGRDVYDYASMARHLSALEFVVLPGIPYGFRRADGDALGQLQVRPGLLRRVLLGIQHQLKAQGFRRILFINGHGPQALNARGLEVLDSPYQHRVGLGFPTDLAPRTVVISSGHIEQHGCHLPLSTDSLIVEAIAQRLSTRAPADVFCLPVWPYGVSTHTREFPGTLSLGGRVFEDFFLEIVDRLIVCGAETVYFSNAHGGNHSFLVNVVKYAGERYPDAFIATEWLHTTGPELAQYRDSERGGMGHGGELETSYLLHLRPDLVHMERATRETEFISTPNYYMDWVEGGRLIANPPWRDDTTSGIYGNGRLGTAEKGNLWLAAAIEAKLDVFQEIREQHRRRRLKRDTQEKKAC